MTSAVLVGCIGAFGLILVVTNFAPARIPLGDALARLHQPRPHPPEASANGTLVRLVGRPLARSNVGYAVARRLERDLRVSGRTGEELMTQIAICGLAGLLWAPVTATLMRAGGVTVSFVLPAWLSLGLALIGGLVPIVSLRSKATERRRAFRHALGCFLDLVAVRLAGGAGVESALTLSAATGHGWSFLELRQALTESRRMGEPPWTGIDRLGTALGISELSELAASVTLAGDEGARIRSSIASKARAIRLRGLAEAEGAAQSASERMSLPIVLLMVGFVGFLGYPAVMQVLTGL